MKKLILLLVLFLLVSCNKYVTKNIYEGRYATEEIAISDVYTQLDAYELDSIPLDEWITNQLYADTTVILQRTVRKIVDEKTNYTFTLTYFQYPSDSYYQFVIRYTGLKK